MAELAQPTEVLIKKYELWEQSQRPHEGVPAIHVDEVASRVAAFYERIRTIIDWKEEHLMRRAAIIRKLRRRFLDLELNDFATTDIAGPLVLELIRGGYFPNDKIEETKIKDVQHILEKYVFIFKNSPENKQGKIANFYSRLLEIAACEIEETLAPSIKEMALMDYMFEIMRSRIRVSDSVYQRGLLKKEETDIQIYIAVQQALFKLDAPIVSYNLLRYKYPYWNSPSQEELLKISQNIHKILLTLQHDLSHPMAKKFYSLCEKHDTPFLLMGDVLAMEPPESISTAIQDPASLEGLTRTAYSRRLKELKAKITRAAIYSTVSIFITKILTLLVLEFVVVRIIFGISPNLFALGVDLLLPTALMGTLVLSVKTPSKKNLNLAVMETMNIVYKKEKESGYDIKVSRPPNVAVRFFLSLIYSVSAVVSFAIIYGIFSFFHFSVMSIVINFIFIALILFTGTAVRRRSQELTIEESREGFLSFISDMVFLPIAETGRWLSNTFKQYNAISAFFNALIDMPFSAFVEFLEIWRFFLRERKEDLS
jgi:hypothetical protein